MVLAFVAVMLVLALAAQSLQEVIKIMFALKSQAAVKAIRGLIREAAKVNDLEGDAEAIFQSVFTRLQRLGQKGVRPKALRLDTLTADKLEGLIKDATQVIGSSLLPVADDLSRTRLEKVAAKAKEWFPLAWEPVDDRYRRRMRGFAILSAAIVVIGFNAGAFDVLQRAQKDPAYRAAAIGTALRLDTLAQRERRLSDTTQAGRDTTAAGRKARADSLKMVRDSMMKSFQTMSTDSTAWTPGVMGKQRWDDIKWWIGILLSTLLVSLGAPFWHDLLESLFGFKSRIQAEAKAASAAASVREAVKEKVT
jgi:hypothetical protein